MVHYEGIFFEDEEALKTIFKLEKKHLPIIHDKIHCTFKYNPNDNEIFDNIVGNTYEINLISYGCDNENSGFEIELPEELLSYYINYDEDNPQKLKKSHITTSISETAKAKNTKNLNFKPLDKPYTIKGKFGYWIEDGKKEYVSYNKYKS